MILPVFLAVLLAIGLLYAYPDLSGYARLALPLGMSAAMVVGYAIDVLIRRSIERRRRGDRP